MHSGDGEEASGSVHRPLPIPRDQHPSPESEPREGMVLPSKGGRWIPPSELRGAEQPPAQPGHPAPEPSWDRRPDAGHGWDAAGHDPYAQQPAAPGYGNPPQPDYPSGHDARVTHPLDPYGQAGAGGHHRAGDDYQGGYDASYGGAQPSGDADRTQLLAPYGGDLPTGGQDADSTQLLAPYAGHGADLPPGDGTRQPLPPEQRFNAPVPPLPTGEPPRPDEPQAPPMPSGAPYAIRPGAPADQASAAYDAAPPTQRLPRVEDQWQQGAPPSGGSGPADDYDFLYRRDDQPAAPAGPHPAAAGQAGAGQPPRTGRPQQHPQPGRAPDAPGPRAAQRAAASRRKPSPVLLAGAAVAVLAVVGIGVGAIMGGGGGSPKTGTSASASTATTTSAAAEAEARRLDSLLASANDSRTSVINAVASIKGCKNLPASAAALRSAAAERDRLVSRLSQMSLADLPNGSQLSSQLSQAWNSSSAADKYYAAWAGQAGKPKGCHKGKAKITLAVQRGNLASGEATIAKQKAAQMWNPIAKQYGLTQRQYTQM